MMIFIPFDPQAARSARAAGRSDDQQVGYAATARLIEAHDYRRDEREDADYAAQLYASVAGLIDAPDSCDRRLVVAADVPLARVSDHDHDLDYGAVRVDGLDWSDVTAVFVDEDAAGPAVTGARKEIADSIRESGGEGGMGGLLELPAVAALTDNHELLWHTPDEAW